MKQQIKYYNQTEIADILGVSKATISRYINKLDISGNIKNKEKLYDEGRFSTFKYIKKYEVM